MGLSEEKLRLFEQMAREMDAYYLALEEGRRPPRPPYDQKLFDEFLDWRQRRMHKKMADYYAEKERRQQNEEPG